MSTSPGTIIYENIDFSVVDHGSDGIDVTYVGRRFGAEVSETRRLVDKDADRIREMIRITPPTRIPWLLSERLGVQRVWRPVCLVNLRWAREYEGGILHVSRDKAEDGSYRYWLETRSCEGYLCGEYGTAVALDIATVRELTSRIANQCRSKEGSALEREDA